MLKKWEILFFILMISFTAGAHIQAETLQLTLEQAIALGLKNSTTLKTKLLAVNAARASVQAAKSPYYPEISVTATYTHLFKREKVGDQYVSSSDPIGVSTDLTQTIYTFGQVKNAVKVSEENVSLAEMDFEEEKRKLIVEIKRAFYTYILTKEVLNVQEETLQYREETLDVAQKRFEAGLTPNFEVLSAETDVENFRPNVISAANKVNLAILAVKDLLGIEDDGDFDVELVGGLEPREFEFERKDLIERALQNQYDIQQYQKNIRLMEISEEITRSQKKPVISGFASYLLQSGFDPTTGDVRYWGTDSWTGRLSAGVAIQWPLSALFPWSKENADIVKESLDVEAMRIGLSTVESGIRFNIDNILLLLKEEESKIKSRQKGVELASELYDSASERFANGLTSRIELKETLISLNTAQLGYLESIYNYLLALFDLMDAVGADHF
jgi:outer membrane protein TolC